MSSQLSDCFAYFKNVDMPIDFSTFRIGKRKDGILDLPLAGGWNFDHFCHLIFHVAISPFFAGKAKSGDRAGPTGQLSVRN
jgi:hypothetical protein